MLVPVSARAATAGVRLGARRGAALLLALALALTAAVALPVDGARAQTVAGLRINEFTSAGPGGSADDFIELINLGDAPVALAGWAVYRCTGTGEREQHPQTAPLEGGTLAPGEVFVLANASASSDVLAAADVTYTVSLADTGSGVWLEAPDGRRVDAVAMYGPDADSECGDADQVLPNRLDQARAQTYQRVATTGDAHRDFVAATRTPGTADAPAPDAGVQPSDVRITEVTNGGPRGSWDNFVEIANRGDVTVSIGGWRLSRCEASGVRFPSGLQAIVPAGTELAPGRTFVFAHTSVAVPAGVPHVRYGTSLANAGFGVMLEDDQLVLRDAVGVYDRNASACTQGTALPNALDFGHGHSYQRVAATGDDAADFVVRTRTIGVDVRPDPTEDPPPPERDAAVRISEVTPSGPAGPSDSFLELVNDGDAPVSLAGWTVHRCQADGWRFPVPMLGPLGDVSLAPGATFVAAHVDGVSFDDAGIDARFEDTLVEHAYGLIVTDADGAVVDRVGAYAPGWPAGGPVTSACTDELPARIHVDTAAGESLQRVGDDGTDARDFVAAPRTPGRIATDLRRATERTAAELAPVDVAPQPRPLPATDLVANAARSDGTVTLSARAGSTTGGSVDLAFHVADRVEVGAATVAATGVSDEAPPAGRVGDDERTVPRGEVPFGGAGAPLAVDSDVGYPYLRMELDVGRVDGDTLEVAWSGRTSGANELQLYAWDHTAAAWQRLDAAGGRVGEPVALVGHVAVDDSVRDGRLDVLVQDGPATRRPFLGTGDDPGAFADPSTYDGAIGVLPDTQFLAQRHPDVLADQTEWLVRNQDARRIDYSVHVGDLVQSWEHGTDREAVAREEFRVASDAMAILDEAAHPYGVLPGNHDNKWGRDADLFNAFFGPDRFAGRPHYVGPWRPGDNTNHADLIDVGGTELLAVHLGYGAGDDAIAWANEVIGANPDRNVVLVAHEYLDASGEHASPTTHRWTSRGRDYFERVVAPNPNVVLTLSGHFHGATHTVRRAADGLAGPADRTVLELFADYQGFARAGVRDTGFLRLLQLDLDAGAVAVDTYSPTLDEHGADEYDPLGQHTAQADAFTAPISLAGRYPKSVVTETVGVAVASDGPAATATVADGQVATVEHGPVTGSQLWHVVARDAAGRQVRSPVQVVEVGATTPAPTPDPGPGPQPDPGPAEPERDTVTCPASTPTFRDVPRASVHHDAIGCLAALEIVLGRDDGRFGPHGEVTRAQAASMVHRLLVAYGVPTPRGRGFPDVDPRSTHAAAIASLAELGVLEGKAGGRFDPSASLTRAQTASVVARAAEVVRQVPLPAGRDAFDDDDGSVHEGAIDAAAAAGLVEGKGGRRFAPGDHVRRDQLASMLARAIRALG